MNCLNSFESQENTKIIYSTPLRITLICPLLIKLDENYFPVHICTFKYFIVLFLWHRNLMSLGLGFARPASPLPDLAIYGILSRL